MCEQNLYKLRQIYLALGKHRPRVHRVLVTLNGRDDPRLTSLLEKPYVGTKHVLGQTIKMAKGTLKAGEIYIVDPRYFVILRYPKSTRPRGILKDLQRLLKYSTIG